MQVCEEGQLAAKENMFVLGDVARTIEKDKSIHNIKFIAPYIQHNIIQLAKG